MSVGTVPQSVVMTRRWTTLTTWTSWPRVGDPRSAISPEAFRSPTNMPCEVPFAPTIGALMIQLSPLLPLLIGCTVAM